MTAATQAPDVTQQLEALFDHAGVEALALNFEQALAEAAGLNRTSASIGLFLFGTPFLRPAGLPLEPGANLPAMRAGSPGDVG